MQRGLSIVDVGNSFLDQSIHNFYNLPLDFFIIHSPTHVALGRTKVDCGIKTYKTLFG